jgi:hypothetical protein
LLSGGLCGKCIFALFYAINVIFVNFLSLKMLKIIDCCSFYQIFAPKNIKNE